MELKGFDKDTALAPYLECLLYAPTVTPFQKGSALYGTSNISLNPWEFSTDTWA